MSPNTANPSFTPEPFAPRPARTALSPHDAPPQKILQNSPTRATLLLNTRKDNPMKPMLLPSVILTLLALSVALPVIVRIAEGMGSLFWGLLVPGLIAGAFAKQD